MSGAAADIGPVVAALWPAAEAGKTEVYAVLDGARDRRIEGLLSVWGLAHVCLYGDVGAELRNAAPFLVRLERGREGTELLLERAWGKGWGIFAVVPVGVGMRRVTRHFKRLLRVMDEAGRVMLFRYYDPAVFRAFMPLHGDSQIVELFGGALRYCMEDGDRLVAAFTPGRR